MTQQVKKTPKHKQIADELRKQIAAGMYEGLELPRELSLMTGFNVSRHTIRSALQHLVDEGLIERRAGSGTRISQRARSGVWVMGSLHDLIGEFTPDQYLTISAQEEPARQHPAISSLFRLGKDDRLFHVLRLMLIDSKPYALASMFTLAKYGRAIPSAEIGRNLLFELVQRYGRVRAVRARQAASACSADEEIARQLGVEPGTAVLLLKRTYFDVEDRPFIHTIVMCRPDRYEQVTDFVHKQLVPDGNGSAAPDGDGSL